MCRIEGIIKHLDECIVWQMSSFFYFSFAFVFIYRLAI